MASAGNESVRKAKPGSGLGRSRKPGWLMVSQVLPPLARNGCQPPDQCASRISPLVEPAVGNSSQAIQKPPDPSTAIDDPCEYVDPGRVEHGGRAPPMPRRVGSVATWIGDATFWPLHEPKCDQET